MLVAVRLRHIVGWFDHWLLGRKNPAYENAYLTLAKIYLAAGRRAEGLQMLDRLLARNPSHAAARDLVARFR